LATTAADRAALRTSLIPLLLVIAASCVSGSVPSVRPTPRAVPPSVSDWPSRDRDPEIRVGIVVGAPSISVSAAAAVVVAEPDGSRITTIPPGRVWRASRAGRQMTLAGEGSAITGLWDVIVLSAVDPAVPLQINGKPYRGIAELLVDSSGITVVNRLGIEAYLEGVVSAEMGRRSAAEWAALEAQAVVSRTYAIRNLGRRKARGFDLSATVNDQVYLGVSGETAEARQAVRQTRGQVLVHEGVPIEAFFYSTCGGRTADGYEVFRGAARPYLRSITDRAEDGSSYCRISPRYRWREEWTDASLRTTLQRNLPSVAGIRSDMVREVRDIRVARRTPSGRVDQLAIALSGPEIQVHGLAIRQVLRPSTGELLRSNAFTLTATNGGGRVTHLSADGMGAGHGVGFCQWGAVGRARVGQGYEQILAAYFPGTRVTRRY
jgi:stage II sporulation protein D